jgi:hypothetical protein
LPHPPLHFACLLCLSYVFHVLDLPFFCLSCFMLLFSYPSHFTLLLSRTLYFMLLLLCPLQFAFLSCLLRFMLLLSCPLNLCWYHPLCVSCYCCCAFHILHCHFQIFSCYFYALHLHFTFLLCPCPSMFITCTTPIFSHFIGQGVKFFLDNSISLFAR